PCRFLAEKIWIINESVSYFNEFRPLDCFVATLLATTVPKIVPYREPYLRNLIFLESFCNYFSNPLEL
ncbi:TPA: hypothetical protein ACF6GT_003290, partial [Legionella pneumophila]